ncbi:MAG TPA: hypothetical protein VHY58_14140 [Streptosporangiaceae bacterium]|nr:hypothetical protein [Streptosporangiaceae bacterium]
MRTLPVLRGAALAAVAAMITLTGCGGQAATVRHSAMAPPAGTPATGGWHGVKLTGPAAQARTAGFAATDRPGLDPRHPDAVGLRRHDHRQRRRPRARERPDPQARPLTSASGHSLRP